jgi:hypothetical protein
MAEKEPLIYYKTNVKFTIGIRMSLQDRQGRVLTPTYPYIAVKESEIRDFKMANRRMLEKGYLMQVEEPSLDIDTENTITDDQAVELVKSLFTLKKKLPLITSAGTLGKLLDEARVQKRSQKIIDMIEERLSEISPELMFGVE